jgi:rod shape-determining protein MreC
VSLVLASVVLMTLDHRFHHLETVRSVIATVLSPLQSLVNLPVELGDWAGETFASSQRLLEENAELHAWRLEQQASLQRQAALLQENARLRRLLGASERVPEEVLVAELVAVDVDPYRHQVVVNKGLRDGVHLEQPLLAAEGVMGQILHLGAVNATAILITDPSHALPVQVNRTGMRTVARGTGTPNRLQLPHIPNDADIQVGDLLVTSGLGGRFPRGYPVGEITEVERDPGRPFASVIATPSVQLDRSLEVLLVQTRLVEPDAQGATPDAANGEPAADASNEARAQ